MINFMINFIKLICFWQGIEIGEFTTENVSSLEYCARLLSSNFLLAGKQGKLISDKSVRVSIKSLALGCIAEAVKLYPKTFVIDVCLEVQDSNTKSGKFAIKL